MCVCVCVDMCFLQTQLPDLMAFLFLLFYYIILDLHTAFVKGTKLTGYLISSQ